MISIANPLIGAEERAAVDKVLKSGIIAQGPEVAKFEAEFAEMCGVKYAVATSSGTTAGHLVMIANNIGPGDEVITTPFTFFATASVVMMVGAKPIFIDVERDGFCLNPEGIQSVITDKTKAIHPVHLYGELADIPKISKIAKDNNLVLIEDSAQAHCAEDWGGKAGSFGDAGWFSFYPTKNMTTSEGGMITTNNKELADRCKILRAHGMSAQYQHTEFGYNYRMTDISAAIGRVQLKRLPSFNTRRREIAMIYNEHLSQYVQVPKNRRGHVFHQYTILSKDRDKLREHLQAKEVGSGTYYPNLLFNYESMSQYSTECPRAQKLTEKALSLPVHPALTDKDVSTVIDAVISFFD